MLRHKDARAAYWLLAGLFLLVGSPAVALPGDGPARKPELIERNNNTVPAGQHTEGVLSVHIEARPGVWMPDGAGGPALEVAGFGELGKPLQNPGPLLRASEGTQMRVMVHNNLDKTLTIFGLGNARGLADSVVIAAGSAHTFSFTAGAPGTYFYAGKTTEQAVIGRGEEDSQLNGVLIIDPADGHRPANERIFLLSEWFRLDSTQVSGLHPHSTLAINGGSWPHTERIEALQGEEQHWRVVNVINMPHPMHLHGFYYRVDAIGDDKAEEDIVAQNRRVVTQLMRPGTTMRMTWVPERPGNWIFHCHFATHIMPLDMGGHSQATFAHEAHPSEMPHQMAGLVVGVTVKPNGPQPALAPNPRALTLDIRSKPRVFGDKPAFAYVLRGTPDAADPSRMPVPGPLLVLQRDEPVAVNIVNRSHEPAAVHWHGIELESFPDGVPGWSGQEQAVLPAIPPGDSLTVRFTPPRAGTFMYHSHFNEHAQLASGLVGPIVVVEPERQFDSATDHVLLFSDDSPWENFITGPFSGLLLNGKKNPDALVLKANAANRLRLINITTDWGVSVELRDGDEKVMWRAVAKDGAELSRPGDPQAAVIGFAAGEIYDFEVPPMAAGNLKLVYAQIPEFDRKPVEVPVIIR